jgi:hypothetical protein
VDDRPARHCEAARGVSGAGQGIFPHPGRMREYFY